jgi:hypothetical protein
MGNQSSISNIACGVGMTEPFESFDPCLFSPTPGAEDEVSERTEMAA